MRGGNFSRRKKAFVGKDRGKEREVRGGGAPVVYGEGAWYQDLAKGGMTAPKIRNHPLGKD